MVWNVIDTSLSCCMAIERAKQTHAPWRRQRASVFQGDSQNPDNSRPFATRHNLLRDDKHDVYLKREITLFDSRHKFQNFSSMGECERIHET